VEADTKEGVDKDTVVAALLLFAKTNSISTAKTAADICFISAVLATFVPDRVLFTSQFTSLVLDLFVIIFAFS
jgi:hypothetical protein